MRATFIFCMLLTGFGSALASAQSFVRSGIFSYHQVEVGGGTGEAKVEANAVLTDMMLNVSATTGVSAPGELLVVGTSDFLVSGYDATGARLEHWSSQTGVLVRLSYYSQSGGDLWNIAWDESASYIYSVEASSGTLLRAYWPLGSNLATLTWSILATATNWSDLTDLPEVYAVPDPQNPGTLVPWVGFDFGFAVHGKLFVGSPGSVTQVWHDPFYAAVQGPNIALRWEALTEDGTTVTVDGPSGATIEVVDVDTGTVAGSGQIPTNGSQVIVSLLQPAQIGTWYAPRVSGTTTDPLLSHYCVRRYGLPGVTPSGTAMRFLPAPYDAEVGNLDFLVHLQLEANPPPSQAVDISAYALIGLGFRNSSAQDPIISTSSGPMLDPNVAALLPVQGHITEHGLGRIVVEQPIPNDPSLQGMVALYQIAYDDGSGLTLSEIIGVMIR